MWCWQVSEEFPQAARAVGRTIIEESTLPEAQRTYKPLSGKGIGQCRLCMYLLTASHSFDHCRMAAGGEKYLTAGIFIKLTKDFAGIYGRRSALCAYACELVVCLTQVATWVLRRLPSTKFEGGWSLTAVRVLRLALALRVPLGSLKELIACNVDELFFPMMCIVDYLGLRLVCTSFIGGIGSKSLVYGSQDAGRTIHCADPRMNAKVRLACELKNLRGHNVIVRIASLASPASECATARTGSESARAADLGPR